MKIGITQRGDACLDLSWVNKLNEVNGVVAISKGFNEEFDSILVDPKIKDNIIYHATITGLGGSDFQPNVPTIEESYEHLKKLIVSGFHLTNIVVRIDPIIGETLYNQLKNKCHYRNFDSYYDILFNFIIDCYENLGIKRFRYSFLDLYNHVRERLTSSGFNVPKYALSFDEIKEFEHRLSFLECKYRVSEFKPADNKDFVVFDTDIHFESCAEQFVPQTHKIGCISKLDFKILGLDQNECNGSSNQRKLCLCPCCKTELLNNKTRCNHKCLYCYWKD